MAEEANLIVTYDPTHKESAVVEIENLAKSAKEKARVLKAEEGVAEVIVGNAKKLVKQLTELCKKDAEKFAYTFHWIPIEKWTKNAIPDMQKIIKEIQKDIAAAEKWKMDLKMHKQKEKVDEIKLILKLTEVVEKPKVDLEKPQKIIKVEIIGNKAGLSLLLPEEYLNVAKFK